MTLDLIIRYTQKSNNVSSFCKISPWGGNGKGMAAALCFVWIKDLFENFYCSWMESSGWRNNKIFLIHHNKTSDRFRITLMTLFLCRILALIGRVSFSFRIHKWNDEVKWLEPYFSCSIIFSFFFFFYISLFFFFTF